MGIDFNEGETSDSVEEEDALPEGEVSEDRVERKLREFREGRRNRDEEEYDRQQEQLRAARVDRRERLGQTPDPLDEV